MATRTAPPAAPPLARWRINMILLACLVLALANGRKLFDVQVVRHAELSGLAATEVQSKRTLLPQRGIIRDSDGGVLAMNVDRDTLGVTPRLIDPERVDTLALVLAPLVGRQPSEVKQLLTDTTREYVVLGRRLTPEASEQVRQLDESALVLTPEPIRVYPHGTFASSIVGVANHENVGISGVEGYANALLSGVPGSMEAEIDSAANPIWIDPPEVQAPRDGAAITLTIDPGVQRIIEEELAQAIGAKSASGGTILVLDPQTGAVLGMASWPFYDPNRYTEYSPEVYNRNPAVSDQYEPGSTFKVINLAIGFQNHAFTPDTVVDDPGYIARAPGCCSNWNGAGHAPMNPANVLLHSSNVGALQFAEMTGAEHFYQGVHDFGYGEPTGIEINGEGAGMVQWPDSTEDWRPIVLSTNGYGQGISVTPLQHLRAIAAVANGGKLMQPYLIKQWCEGEECHTIEPKVIRQVIDPEVSELIKPMMVRTANNSYAFAQGMWEKCLYEGYYDPNGNSGGVALVPGYNVAAKTGTSSIPDGNGGYENATIGSVIGFGPVEEPKFAVLVKLDRPSDVWGSLAIPVYAHVMERLLTHYHIPPDPSLIADCQR